MVSTIRVIRFTLPQTLVNTYPGRPQHRYRNDSLLASNHRLVEEKSFVRSGIRTHAHRSGLRPERSALDRSAILTVEIEVLEAGIETSFNNSTLDFHLQEPRGREYK